MDKQSYRATAPTKKATPNAPPRRLATDTLLAGAREVILEHRGEDYRLRVTANGKLILTK